MKIPLWKSIVIVLIVYPVAVLWMLVMYWIANGFRGFGGNNIVRVFVYIPLIAYPVAKLLKISWKDICALLSIGPVAVHGISHFGCMFTGCCCGYTSSWGLYNVATYDIRFPIQPIEALIAVAIIVYLLIRAKKHNYVSDGREYPLMMVIFGSTRFVCEFLRDNDKMILGISNLAFHALFMFIVGVIALVIINKKQKKVQILNQE